MIEFLSSERVVLTVGTAVFSAAFGVLWYAAQRYFVTQRDHDDQRAADAATIAKLTESVDKLLSRVIALEQRVNALPTEAMFNNLMLRLETFSGDQRTLSVRLEALSDATAGINRAVTLIQQHLMENR